MVFVLFSRTLASCSLTCLILLAAASSEISPFLRSSVISLTLSASLVLLSIYDLSAFSIASMVCSYLFLKASSATCVPAKSGLTSGPAALASAARFLFPSAIARPIISLPWAAAGAAASILSRVLISEVRPICSSARVPASPPKRVGNKSSALLTVVPSKPSSPKSTPSPKPSIANPCWTAPPFCRSPCCSTNSSFCWFRIAKLLDILVNCEDILSPNFSIISAVLSMAAWAFFAKSTASSSLAVSSKASIAKGTAAARPNKPPLPPPARSPAPTVPAPVLTAAPVAPPIARPTAGPANDKPTPRPLSPAVIPPPPPPPSPGRWPLCFLNRLASLFLRHCSIQPLWPGPYECLLPVTRPPDA